MVQVSSLPSMQTTALQAWLDRKAYTKVTVNGVTFDDCIPYSLYAFWFDRHFSRDAHQDLHLNGYAQEML